MGNDERRRSWGFPSNFQLNYDYLFFGFMFVFDVLRQTDEQNHLNLGRMAFFAINSSVIMEQVWMRKFSNYDSFLASSSPLVLS